MRKRTDLAKELHIDVVKIGRQILLQQFEKENLQIETPDMADLVKVDDFEMSEEQCRQAFHNAIRKIELIRNTSSPILKVIQLARCMDEIMGVMGDAGEI